MNDRQTDWMAVEWRPGALRIWVMDDAGQVQARLDGTEDTRGLGPEALEIALGGLIAGYLEDDAPMEILIAGDPARPGFWSDEVAGRTVPCRPVEPGSAVRVTMRDARLDVRMVPGLVQAAPPALMLADTLRVAGYLAANDGFDGVLCLPGARSHWVHVSAGEVVSFQTVLTRDLTEGSLRAMNVEPMDKTLGEIGLASMEDVMSRPERIGQKIGSNAAQIALGKASAEDSREAVLGAFLGLELAAMKPFWLGQQVALIGRDGMRSAYARALEAQGIAPIVADEEETLLAGFRVAR